MAIDPTRQHELFRKAVELLGGSRSAARALGVGERTMTGLVAGTFKLHDGFLRDISAALLRHADACRELEKALNPMFSANRTEDQRAEDGRRTRHQRGAD